MHQAGTCTPHQELQQGFFLIWIESYRFTYTEEQDFSHWILCSCQNDSLHWFWLLGVNSVVAACLYHSNKAKQQASFWFVWEHRPWNRQYKQNEESSKRYHPLLALQMIFSPCSINRQEHPSDLGYYLTNLQQCSFHILYICPSEKDIVHTKFL